MLYMSGRSLNIFTITSTTSALVSPIRSMLNTGQAFRRLESKSSLLQQKAAFVALNLVALGVGLYKLLSMGLLPAKAGDWTSYVQLWEGEEASTPI